MATRHGERGPRDRSEGEPDQRLADPDKYNQSRRLRQLHNAKESVVEIKDRTVERAASGGIPSSRRDHLVAEKLIDYVRELLPLLELRGRDDELLGEEIGTVEGRTVTIGMVVDNHGEVAVDRDRGDGSVWVPYQASMEAWSICNRYFEEIAGAEFEDSSLPTVESFGVSNGDD